MNKDIRVARALSAHIARKVIRVAGLILLVIFTTTMLGIWALASFASEWWWLLMLPWGFIAGLALLSWLIARLVARGLYREPLSHLQRQALDGLTEKVQRLLEARATPPVVFVIVSVKDLLLHRDVTTVKQLIRDTASLRSDYTKLRQLF